MVTIFCWSEEELDKWFLENGNYKALGFSDLQPILYGGDYLGKLNGQDVRIELEVTPSQFFLHKEKVREKIDVIVCWRTCKPRKQEKVLELERKIVIPVARFLKPEELALRKRIFEDPVDITAMGESLAHKQEVTV